MPSYIAATQVSSDVLEKIVIGNYDASIYAEEMALLDKVPQHLMPWFERTVVRPLYLPFRDAMKQPAWTLAQLIVEFCFQKNSEARQQGFNVNRRTWTLRGSFGLRKQRGNYAGAHIPLTRYATFEELVEETLPTYMANLRDIVQISLQCGIPFKYISAKSIIDCLASQIR